MCTVSGDCDVFTASWKQLRVDGAEKSSVVIPHLDADEVYCVKMKSVSSLADSRFTAPLKHRVFRTGNDVGIHYQMLCGATCSYQFLCAKKLRTYGTLLLMYLLFSIKVEM